MKLAVQSKARNIPQLDGLRAVAISLVIVSHSVDVKHYPLTARLGYLGVLIFFSLSGYLITRNLLAEYEQNQYISLRGFYIRRFFRILPPAFFYLGIVWLLTQAGVLHCDWAAIRAALLLYANYIENWGSGWMIGHFWSLSVEEHFYFLWPAILIVSGVRRGWIAACLLALLTSALRIADNRLHFLGVMFNNPGLAHYHSDLVCDTLLWGCCLAFFCKSNESGRQPLYTAIALAAVGLLLGSIMFNVDHFIMIAHALPTVLLGSILATPNVYIGKVLQLPLLRFIGKISYSLYLWQTLFLTHMKLPLALVAITGCALISYWAVEKPFIRMGHRFARYGRLHGNVPQT